jgi:aspartyl/asparaginyl-tRNA synthetase
MEEITVDATVHAVRKHKHVIFIDAQSQDSSFQVLIRGASRSNVAQLQPTSVWRIMGSLGVSST